jgi:hypothetical protein
MKHLIILLIFFGVLSIIGILTKDKAIDIFFNTLFSVLFILLRFSITFILLFIIIHFITKYW